MNFPHELALFEWHYLCIYYKNKQWEDSCSEFPMTFIEYEKIASQNYEQT